LKNEKITVYNLMYDRVAKYQTEDKDLLSLGIKDNKGTELHMGKD